jgi:hypothetical protein
MAAFWRLDPHHDGFTYLPARLAEIGKFPPNGAGSNYGIAQAVFEGAILNLVPNYFIFYRFIAVALILISGILIYRIIALGSKKIESILFMLLWLFANPTWQNSIKTIPQTAQAVWPNLWIQTITLLALFIIQRFSNYSKSQCALLGIIIATLPFIRVQGIISSVFILMLIKVRKNRLKEIVYSSMLTFLFWLFLIQVSGGVSSYYKDIFSKPREGLVKFLSFEYFVSFAQGLVNYYIVITFTMLLILVFILKMIRVNFAFSSKQTIFIILVFAIATSRHPEIWPSVFIAKSSTLILDLAFVCSVIYAFTQRNLMLKVLKKKTYKSEDSLFILSLFSICNHLNLYPIPDEGHKWWSSAVTLIFLARLIEKFKDNQFLKPYKLVKIVNNTMVASLVLSSVNVICFLSIERYTISSPKISIYRYLQYPVSDFEKVKTFQNSMEVLSFIESTGMKINYVCRDPLYYVGNQRIAKSVDKVFDFVQKPYILDLKHEVNFLCSVSSSEVINLENYNYAVIGRGLTNLFVYNKDQIDDFNEVITRFPDSLMRMSQYDFNRSNP